MLRFTDRSTVSSHLKSFKLVFKAEVKVRRVNVDKTGSSVPETDIKSQTPLASCSTWQLVQAVKCLWATTYRNNLIIYFSPNMPRHFYFIPDSSPSALVSVWSLSVFVIRELPWLQLLSWDEKALSITDGTKDDFVLNQSFFFFPFRESLANLAQEDNVDQR